MEDADLLKDGMEAQGHRLSQQPAVIKHGIMRDYQMQGLNWLIHLYDNGINGILADEMVSCAPSTACMHHNALLTDQRTFLESMPIMLSLIAIACP